MNILRVIAVFSAVFAIGGSPVLAETKKDDPRRVIWQGTVLVDKLYTVPEGELLVIQPGTTVKFVFHGGDGGIESGILVQGGILARGTAEQPILFEPEKEGNRGEWWEVRIEGASIADFKYALFRNGYWPVHSHYADLRIESCLFEDNVGGVRFRGGSVKILKSVFRRNGTAIRYWESDPEISASEFSRNGTAIFCREGSLKSRIVANNFIESSEYHVKLGEMQEADVNAGGNYWGTLDVGDIKPLVFDREDVPYLGRVILAPLARSAFPSPGADK